MLLQRAASGAVACALKWAGSVVPVRDGLHDSDFTSSLQQLLFVLHKRRVRTNCCIAL